MARVTEAAHIVARQTGCSLGDALGLLRQRAQASGTDLDETAAAVVDQGTRLGYYDFAPSDRADDAVDRWPSRIT